VPRYSFASFRVGKDLKAALGNLSTFILAASQVV
jgi:hypothetical protein